MDNREFTRFFYITSGNQLTSTSNTFTAELQIPTDIDFDRIVLTSINIPVSFYVIQAGFNTFTLTENGTPVTITIPEGNYNVISFQSILTTLLNTNSPNGYTYTMSFPNNYTQTQTGKFTYSVNTINTVSFTCADIPGVNEQLGFNRNSTNYFVASGLSSSLVSSNVVKFIPEDSLLIHSNLVGNTDWSDILETIFFANSVVFGNISWTNPSPLMTSKPFNNRVRLATFSITDEFNLPIFLNGLNISMTIMVYKQSELNRNITDYIQLKTIKFKQLEDEKNNQI